MVAREFYKTREDGANLYRSYSTDGYYIQKVGTDEVYTEAIDVEDATYRYVETNKKIDSVEFEENEGN